MKQGQKKQTLLKLGKTLALPSVLVAGTVYYLKKYKLAGALTAASVVAATVSAPAYAQISQALIDNYASTMQTAANSRNIGQIAKLLSDDVVVSLTRQGKGTTTLDKSAYLDLLQKGWTQATSYRYTISVNDIVITGDTAKAQVVTVETWVKDGKTTKLTTTSRATLGLAGGNAVLLRSVAQVAVE